MLHQQIKNYIQVIYSFNQCLVLVGVAFHGYLIHFYSPNYEIRVTHMKIDLDMSHMDQSQIVLIVIIVTLHLHSVCTGESSILSMGHLTLDSPFIITCFFGHIQLHDHKPVFYCCFFLHFYQA